jgi:hypothetical protein
LEDIVEFQAAAVAGGGGGALEIAIDRFGRAPDHVAAIIVPRIRCCSNSSSSISRTKNQTY